MIITLLNYTLNVAAKTISLDDLTAIYLPKLKSIYNQTAKAFIYNINDANDGKSYTPPTVAANVLTFANFDFSGKGMANTDVLLISYDDPNNTFQLSSAATNNSTLLKGKPGTVFGIVASNANAAVRYLKLYNKATAPTVGTDKPVMILPIPASGNISPNLGLLGHLFTLGIGIAIVTGIADTDNTAVALDEVKVSISYI